MFVITCNLEQLSKVKVDDTNICSVFVDVKGT